MEGDLERDLGVLLLIKVRKKMPAQLKICGEKDDIKDHNHHEIPKPRIL